MLTCGLASPALLGATDFQLQGKKLTGLASWASGSRSEIPRPATQGLWDSCAGLSILPARIASHAGRPHVGSEWKPVGELCGALPSPLVRTSDFCPGVTCSHPQCLSLGLSPFQLWNTDSSRPDLATKGRARLGPFLLVPN